MELYNHTAAPRAIVAVIVLRVLSLAACRMRASACVTVSQFCARPVLCWLAFPSVPALGSPGSAAGCPALFAGFIATMAGSDHPRPCIIGFGSSPSRCVPEPKYQSANSEKSRVLPSSGAIPSRVMCSWTPAGCPAPRLTVPFILRSTMSTVSAPAISPFRGSLTHPT